MSKCEICKADCIFKGEKDPKPMCRGFIPMSVADRVRTMSDEELAEFLLYDIDRDAYGTTVIGKDLIFSKDDMICWLQQPVKEDA